MAAWTTIPDSDVDPESPITTSLMQALRDNPVAIAEGATGAPLPVSLSFSAHRNGVSQTSVGTAATKIKWTTEDFDTNSDFVHDADDSGGAAESRYTPTVAGKYLILASLDFDMVATADFCSVLVYKNGSLVRQASIRSETASPEKVTIAVIVDMNGTTDYIEIFGANGTNSDTVLGAATGTYFMGSRIT